MELLLRDSAGYLSHETKKIFYSMTSEELDKVRDRLSKVTPGHWTPCIEGRDFDSGSSFIMVQDGAMRREDIEFIGASAADIDFIGNAKRDIAMLLQEIERLKTYLNSADTDTDRVNYDS